MITGTENKLYAIGNLSDLAADVDGVHGYVVTPDRSVKWSEQLRRERLQLFGRGKYVENEDVNPYVLKMPQNAMRNISAYVDALRLFVEAKENKTIQTLYGRKLNPKGHHARAFLIILRHGFGLQKLHICKTYDIKHKHYVYIMHMYKQHLTQDPAFMDAVTECLEHLEQCVL
jgi:hypothetical protein